MSRTWSKLHTNWDEKAQTLFTVCGVPKGLQRNLSINFDRALETFEIKDSDENKPPRVIDKSIQIDQVQKLFNHNFNKPLLVTFNSVSDFLAARQVAVALFFRAIQKAHQSVNENFGDLPTWHYVSGSFQNPLLHAYETGKYRTPMLLVLDGLDTSMSAVKLEKARDLVNLFCDRPIFMLMSGPKVGEYIRDNFYIRKPHVLYFCADMNSNTGNTRRQVGSNTGRKNIRI